MFEEIFDVQIQGVTVEYSNLPSDAERYNTRKYKNTQQHDVYVYKLNTHTGNKRLHAIYPVEKRIKNPLIVL